MKEEPIDNKGQEQVPILIDQIKREVMDENEQDQPVSSTVTPQTQDCLRSDSGHPSGKRRRTEKSVQSTDSASKTEEADTTVPRKVSAHQRKRSKSNGNGGRNSESDTPMPSSNTADGEVGRNFSRSRSGSSDNVPQLGPRPVQIITFDDDDQSGNKMYLNKTLLKPIIDKAGDRPVVIISIVGQSQRGKSLFLNFLLHHLVGLEKGTNLEEVWTENNVSIPKGFDWGTQDRTSGIYFWSHPITLRLKNEEYAIFLMDTEGLMFSAKSEFMWTVGLSTLVSSCLIFNQDLDKNGRLNEDYFLSFIDHVQAVMKDMKLQTLLFLVRDSICISNPFGKVDLKPFLREQFNLESLESNINQSSSHRSVIHRHCNRIRASVDLLTTAFERSACYCLPFPFPPRSQNAGSDAISTITSSFHSAIISAIKDIVSPENLQSKKIGGTEITSTSLGTIFEAFVQLFNNTESSNLPIGCLTQHCIKQLQDSFFINQQLKTYETNLKAHIQNSLYGFISRDELWNQHQKLRHEILEGSKSHTFENSESDNVRIIQTGIDELYKTWKAKNDKSLTIAYTHGFWDHFDSSMEEWETLIQAAMTLGHISDETAKNIENTCSENFKKKFSANAQQLADRLATALIVKIQRRYNILKQMHDRQSAEPCQNCKLAEDKAQLINTFYGEMERHLPIGQFVLPAKMIKDGESIVSTLNDRPDKSPNYTPKIRDFIPAFKLIKERNARNAPCLGFLVEGSSIESLRIKFATYYANGEISQANLMEDLPFDVQSLVSVRECVERDLGCRLTQAAFVSSMSLKPSEAAKPIIEKTFKEAKFKSVSRWDEFSALILACISKGLKVENKILAVILIVDNGDNTVDVQSSRVSESVVDLGKEGMTCLKFGTDEEANESLDRIKRLATRWLENDQRPCLILVSQRYPEATETSELSLEEAQKQTLKQRQVRQNNFFFKIQKAFRQMEYFYIKKSEIALGVAACGELMRRRLAGSFSLRRPSPVPSIDEAQSSNEVTGGSNTSFPVKIPLPLLSVNIEPPVTANEQRKPKGAT